MDYNELLKSPKWQKKRLEVLQRDNFTCQVCGSKDKTLNVHHTYYDRTKKPWEYPMGAFITLCEECHKKEHSKHSTQSIVKSASRKIVLFRNLLKEKRLLANEKIILSYILVHKGANNTQIATVLNLSRKTVVDALKTINKSNWISNKHIVQGGYFELKHHDLLKGELLIFYSFLLSMSEKYDHCIDTYKAKIGKYIGKEKVAVTKLLNRLYKVELAERLANGKLLIKQ